MRAAAKVILSLGMDADTHKTLTPVNVSGASAVADNGADGNDDDKNAEDDKRNCTSLPLCYDRVSNNTRRIYSFHRIHTYTQPEARAL